MLAGRPATALKLWDEKIPFSTVLERFYGGRFSSAISRKNIAEQLEKAGSGARGIIMGFRGKDEIAHVFNVVNQKGVVRFLDGQTGTVAKFENAGYLSFHLLWTNKPNII
ncbi:MAG: toxin glutamine deamidase domain-containing protein [Stappiaceae bacterium]